MRSAPSLTLEPRPSRIAAICFALIVLLAAGAIAISAIMLMLKGLLGVILAVAALSAARSLRRPLIARAVLQSDGVWMLSASMRDSEGHADAIPATLISSGLLGALIALTWRDTTSQRRLSILLWPDSIGPQARRQLRVWLRSGRAHAADRQAPNSAS